MRNKIALIMPYFGQWPPWIGLYLKSCSINSFIDFHFFTDCGNPKQVYKNTFFHKISWEVYQGYISKMLGITYKRENAYALCDVKPFYGFIHKDILDKYDFWGYGDLDVCYGDLSKFINDKVLEKNDVISTHADRISGHFAIFRNTEYFRNLCFLVPKWQDKLGGDEMYGIDEHYFTELIFPGIRNIHRVYRMLFSRFKIDYRLGYSLLVWPINLFTRILLKECYTSPAPKVGEEWKFNLSSGEIVAPNGRELPYIHFLFFKKTPFYKTEHYWRQNFYAVPEDCNFNSGTIVFNTEGIRYSND